MGTVMTLKRCLYLLPVIFINAVLANNSYKRYYIESDKLCALGFRPKVVELHKDEQSAAIVEEVEYFSTLSGNRPYSCKFTVESTQSMGVFAVIQRLRLRKNATTGECIDYVQFRHSTSFQLLSVEISTDNSAWGVKHCGDINAIQIDVTSIDPTDNSRVLPYAFVDPKGKVDVKIYIANETIPAGTDLDLKIAFTAYYVCGFNMGKYKKCGADACIWSSFFSDGILNCPFTNCADENGCQIFYDAGIRPSAGLATKVMVGAVAFVFTMFIVFVMFLWLFRNCSLCWNDSPQSAQNTAQMRPVPTVDDAQPTAPPGSPSMAKDLPPSYESLFPNA